MKLSELTWSLILILFKLNVNSEVSEMSTHETHRHRWKWYKQIKCAAFWTSVPQVKFKYATLCCPCRITLCVKRIALWLRGRIHFKSTPFSPPSLCLSITPPHAFSLRLSFFHSVLFSPPYFFSSRSFTPSLPGVNRSGESAWGQRSASAAAMWFPSSNNVSVIYERPATNPAQPPRYSTISSPYHNKLRSNSAGTHLHRHRGPRVGLMHIHVHAWLYRCACVQAQVCFFNNCTCRVRLMERALVNLPFGGGFTSVSPCWFELSDCPDCSAEREKKKERWWVRWTDVWTLTKVRGQVKNRGVSWETIW